MTITKKQLVNEIADKLNQTQLKTQKVVEEFLSAIKHHLESGNRIELRGFGRFGVKVRKPKVGRNPRTGQEVGIPEKRVVWFKVGKELRIMVEEAASPKPQA